MLAQKSVIPPCKHRYLLLNNPKSDGKVTEFLSIFIIFAVRLIVWM